MTNFEKITASTEALGEFLASLPVATGPWDEEFHRAFCDSCEREDCDEKRCPHQAERNNQTWWLNRTAEGQGCDVGKKGRLQKGNGRVCRENLGKKNHQDRSTEIETIPKFV